MTYVFVRDLNYYYNSIVICDEKMYSVFPETKRGLFDFVIIFL